MVRRFCSIAALGCLLAAGFAHAASSGRALTPQSTSVEAGFSQVFSAQFFNASGQPAAGEKVTFYNDASGSFPNGQTLIEVTADANGTASTTYTAWQPGGIVGWVMAAAGAQVRFDVITFGLNQVGIAASAPANLAAGQSFTIPAALRWGIYSLANVSLSARIVPGAGSATVMPASVNSGSAGSVLFTVAPAGPVGDYDVEISYRTITKRVPIRFVSASATHQDLWWAGIGENGWGMSIVQHRDVLFTVIYAYDDAGKPTWFVVPGGTWNADRTAYTGPVYLPQGTPFHAYDASRFAVGTPVGTVTVTFLDGSNATLDYTIQGVAGHKAITRELFGPIASTAPSGLGDMWWGGEAQNGWGIAILQQYDSLFCVWYTYDETGARRWYVMPAGSWTGPGTYEGRIYRTTGSPWLGHAYDASAFRYIDVGSFRLGFSGAGATFEYNAEGLSGVLPLVRQPF